MPYRENYPAITDRVRRLLMDITATDMDRDVYRALCNRTFSINDIARMFSLTTFQVNVIGSTVRHRLYGGLERVDEYDSDDIYANQMKGPKSKIQFIPILTGARKVRVRRNK